MDRTAQQRIKKQREARMNEGWAEARVWVPTKADAEKIQEYAAQLRAKAQELNELDELQGIKKMHPDTYTQIKGAIAEQGSAAYNTPSGAVQTLLSEFARDGYIADFAEAFVLFARAHPSNASFVEASVPGKILNGYFIRNQQIDVKELVAWQKKHPDWAEILRSTVRQPEKFELVVLDMAIAMKSVQHH